ncbi:uncharacterized protein LOC123532892 isoform X1 [Mercenaria mercenaria]|uniref:uncharacterized protein LOC123532892 isoform X1 n=1 Tax=Mercenaria mercenaria TaxID=6596 RepID=UPI00234F8895|nr:uncharacterized protein LOC123532892 isoform X1 [Mercenaria mercenaria]
MKFCRRFYQRLYGFLSLLLLLQECHPAIRSGFTQPKYKSQSSGRNQLDDSVPYNDQSGYDGDWSFRKTINPKGSTPIQLKVEHDYEDEIHFAPRGHVGRISKNASISKYRRSVEQRYAKENDAHVTMEIIKEQLNALSKKFMKNQEGIETKVYSYIESCSSQYSDDLNVFGSIKTPTGVIVRLMLAVIYTIANCQTLSLWVISEITEQIGKKTTFDMLQTFAEITDDLSEKSNQTSGISDDDLDEDMTMSAEESTFLSVLTAENILNTQEMLKLFHVLANNEQFENTTDLNEVLSELDTFSFTELVDKPNYRWIKYPTASETNTTKLGKQPEIDLLVKRLNSNATKRLMREISIPTVLSHNTDILVIYDRKSYKLLSSTDEGLAPTMRDYDSSTLPEQLWILDRGALINVASRSSIHVSFQHNMSNIVLQKHTNDLGQWYNFGGRLSHIAGNSNCFLDTEHNTSISSSHTKNLTIHCDIHIQDVELVIASFSDVNTPETLALHQPETVFVDPISKRIGFKFKIFMYLLGYMIMYLFEDKPSKDVSHNSSQKNQVNLEETFFIKHERKPCKVLTASSVEDKYQISFGDFAEDIIEYQLWYWKESQIINVATQAVLETNYVINEQNVLEENYAKYFRLWTRGNNTIQTFNEGNCELDINSSAKNILVINCSSRRGDTLVGPWSFVPFDQPNFDNFQKVVCMFFIQTFEWPCEFISTSEIYAPSVTPLTDNIYSQLWYMSNGRLINIDLGLALTELSDDSGTTFIGLNTLNSKNLTTWYVGDGQIYPSSSRNTVLSINVSKNGTLSVTQNINTVTQHWKIVDFKKALRNETDLQCADAISRTFNPFVIRNNAIQACKMLTVVENNNSFELQMKDFDKSILDFQTWIIHRRHIINIATGLTIEPDLDNNSSSMDTYLMLRPLHSFQQNQMWRLDDDGYLRWHSDSSCCMHYHFDETSENQDTLRMKCKVHHGSNSMWNFTELPKYDDSPDTLDYMCMYFIKSLQEPCQFITANLNDGSLYLRPMVPEFIEKQLWVWSEQSISLVTTGHYFGGSELKTNMTISELLLVNPDEGNISASWRFDHKKLIATEQETHISVDKTDDGQLFLSNSNGNSGIDLAFVHYNAFLQDLSEDLCGLPITETSTLFFLRSKIDKCKVLTGAELGKRPTFEHFNQDILESQLWFYEDNHLINLHSNLVLHVNTDISIRGSHVTMQNYYKYANAQKWLVSGEMIFFGNSEVCVLEVNQATYQLVICCDVHGGDNQLWEKIEFDDGSSYIDEITCMFFIRHEQVPCELLTDFAHTPSPALRPVSESSFNNQIWYWSGQHIINAATGLVLHGSETKHVSMRRKTQHLADGEWIINGNQVSLSSKSSLILGLNSESGPYSCFTSIDTCRMQIPSGES